MDSTHEFVEKLHDTQAKAAKNKGTSRQRNTKSKNAYQAARNTEIDKNNNGIVSSLRRCRCNQSL